MGGGKKRKVSASCEKQEVYHNNHRRLNMYMTDAEMLPKIINFCLYNINVTEIFFLSQCGTLSFMQAQN